MKKKILWGVGIFVALAIIGSLIGEKETKNTTKEVKQTMDADAEKQSKNKSQNEKTTLAIFKVTKANYNRIQIGMSKQQVLDITGKKPDNVVESEAEGLGKMEQWVYESGVFNKRDIFINFQDGHVFSKDWVD